MLVEDEESSSEESQSERECEERHEPRGRRGACSFVFNNKFHVFQGYLGGPPSHDPECSLQVFDFLKGEWSTVEQKRMPPVISGGCCALIDNHLYVFGGWLVGERNADVYELDLLNYTWQKLDPKNPGEGPFLKDKAGMVAYGQEMLCVFGGYGYPSENHITVGGVYVGQKGATYDWDVESYHDICWMNELHLFHTKKCVWISPETTGTRPPACAAFSFTVVDCHRAVLFGGRQRAERVNEVHILDMEHWHWSGVICQSRPEEPWPSKRSFHTACALVDPACIGPLSSSHSRFEWLPCSPPDLTAHEKHALEPKLMVLWGMDSNADPIHDAWLFSLNSLTWKQIALPECVQKGRIWHTMAAYHPSPGEAWGVTFGGCSENLFQRHEVLVPNVDATTVMKFGVRSLFDQCLEHIASRFSEFSPLLHHLPGYMQCKVENCRTRLDNMKHFIDVRL